MVLTLRTVGGLASEEIAWAFLVPVEITVDRSPPAWIVGRETALFGVVSQDRPICPRWTWNVIGDATDGGQRHPGSSRIWEPGRANEPPCGLIVATTPLLPDTQPPFPATGVQPVLLR